MILSLLATLKKDFVVNESILRVSLCHLLFFALFADDWAGDESGVGSGQAPHPRLQNRRGRCERHRQEMEERR